MPDAVVVLSSGIDDTVSFFSSKMFDNLPEIVLIVIKIRTQRKFLNCYKMSLLHVFLNLLTLLRSVLYLVQSDCRADLTAFDF